MIVCKVFTRVVPRRKRTWKKADLMDPLQGGEKMAAVYYDPSRDYLLSFMDENSDEWDNVYANGRLTFRLRSGGPIDAGYPWERTKVRHVFFRKKGQSEYDYLGTSIDEKVTYNAQGEAIQREFEIME